MPKYVIRDTETGEYLASFGVTVGPRITQIVWTGVKAYATRFSQEADAQGIVERLKLIQKPIEATLEPLRENTQA
jgi:hypothetical protein